MYESFYGLTSSPFQLNPDPAFYFDSRQHRRAKSYLDYGMNQKEGFIVVTGEVGAGKTTILRALIDGLDSQKVLCGNLVSTQLNAEDTLRLVGASFGVRIKDVPKSDLLLTLEAFFVKAAASDKRCLLIVDEAQNLSPESVEELRMLSNFQLGNRALLQTFLVGQPEFRNILQSPRMLQLRQRVIASCHIGPLDADEVQPYAEHRLRCAGSTGAIQFSKECFPAIYRFSGGIPRRINTLCDRLLLGGYLSAKKAFGLSDVEEVVHEISHELNGGPPGLPTPHGLPEVGGALPKSAGGNVAKFDVGAPFNDEVDQLISGGPVNLNERLAKLEWRMLRLERISAATVRAMQQIEAAQRVQGTEHEKKA